VALVVAVMVILGTVNDRFRAGATGYEMIVGAKGSPLQLTLNTVYHLSKPVENIPWTFYQEFLPGGRFDRETHLAIPLCMGDSYQEFRVVGTIPELFSDFGYVRGSERVPYAFSSGENFQRNEFFTAVIGADVQRGTGLKVGDTFNPTHGVDDEPGEAHDLFRVTGVLAPTGTPNDRALFVNMEGFFLLDGHAKPVEKASPGPDHEHAPGTPPHAHETEEAGTPTTPGADANGLKDVGGREALPVAQREVTSILVRLDPNAGLAGLTMGNRINEGQVAQVVYPQQVIGELFEKMVGPLRGVLLLQAVLVVIVSGIGLAVGFYNSMNERRREVAVMRALGASRTTILSIVLLESVLLALLGGLAGAVAGHLAIGLLSPLVAARTGVILSPLTFDLNEMLLIPSLMVLAIVAGMLPALSAYRTDVSRTLSGSP
jgi:putative ABC transport system permease protein